MLSRRSMIRALGFGVPAAAVVAAVGLPESSMAEGPAAPAGKVTVTVNNLHPDAVVDLRDGVLHIRGRGMARQMERAYGLRRSLA